LGNVVSLLSVLSGSSSELNEFGNSLFLEEVTVTLELISDVKGFNLDH